MTLRVKTALRIGIALMLGLLAVPAFAMEIEMEMELELGPDGGEPGRTVTVQPGRVLITDFFVMGGGLVAGETSTVVFVLENTGEAGVNSVVLTGWIDPAAPVEFTGTNQVYVGSIAPGGEASAMFEYYTRNVDLTALHSISAGFTISYGDEAVWAERSNSVAVRLPVLRGARTTVGEEDMRWSEPYISRMAELLTSRAMQALYAGGFVLCSVLAALILLLKLGILKRRF